MDKSCDSSNTSNKDHYLKQLNKFSHKISKPNSNPTNSILLKRPSSPTFDHQSQQSQPQPQHQHQHQHQPPVYNINKNDFRDVVQKLTGSPAHERFSTPPPIQQPKPPSSRLQRIRPPPLAHVSNRPPPLLSCANLPIPPPTDSSTATTNATSGFTQRSTAPLSPLPPLPSVHAAAESPVSAYMRYLQNSMPNSDPNAKPQFSGFSPLAPLVSPRWNSLMGASQQSETVPPPTSQQQQIVQSQPQFQLPSSPLPFGCSNSPRSPHPLLSPGLFSPTSGQLNLPLSPTVPVPSPRWRSL